MILLAVLTCAKTTLMHPFAHVVGITPTSSPHVCLLRSLLASSTGRAVEVESEKLREFLEAGRGGES